MEEKKTKVITIADLEKQRNIVEDKMRDDFYTSKHTDMFQVAKNRAFEYAIFSETEYRMIDEYNNSVPSDVQVPVDMDNVFEEVMNAMMNMDDIQFNFETYEYIFTTLGIEFIEVED